MPHHKIPNTLRLSCLYSAHKLSCQKIHLVSTHLIPFPLCELILSAPLLLFYLNYTFFICFIWALNIFINGFLPHAISPPGRKYWIYFIFLKPPTQRIWEQSSALLWKQIHAQAKWRTVWSRGTLCPLSSAKFSATHLLFLESEREECTLHHRGKC